jgi:hypothetical protein
MVLTRRIRIASLALASLVAAACGSDSTGPGKAQPILGLNATAKGATSIELTFNSVAGDNSYDIERAEGATGAFAAATTVTAPATAGQIKYTDAGLKPTTLYRYHVITHKGSSTSVASGEAQSTTLAFGNAAADLTTDIGANRTLYADTVYTPV